MGAGLISMLISLLSHVREGHSFRQYEQIVSVYYCKRRRTDSTNYLRLSIPLCSHPGRLINTTITHQRPQKCLISLAGESRTLWYYSLSKKPVGRWNRGYMVLLSAVRPPNLWRPVWEQLFIYVFVEIQQKLEGWLSCCCLKKLIHCTHRSVTYLDHLGPGMDVLEKRSSQLKGKLQCCFCWWVILPGGMVHP